MKLNLKALSVFSAFIISACSTPNAEQNTPPAQNNANTPKTVEVQAEKSKSNEVPLFNQAAASIEQTGFISNPNVQAFIRYHSENSGLDPMQMADFFARVQHRANIINTMNRPGTSRPWYEFRPNNAGGTRVSRGKQFYQTNKVSIDRAAAQYGVPAEIITAIIGIETDYGRHKGNVRIADALATLAFDYPRRAALFQKELAALLVLAKQEQRDPFSYQGSFAGAMGMPQFMPSSYLKWAVDGNGDGIRDIWNNSADAAASVANYMKIHGWQTGGKIMIPVAMQETDQLRAIIDENTALKRTVGELKQLGVQPLQNVADHEKAILFRLESAPGVYDYYIGLNNFYTIWQYNHSRMYVAAVREIANGIGNNGL